MKLAMQAEKIQQLIKEAKTIAVVGHRNPDGDCIGCCIAIAEWLESKGKLVSLFTDGEISQKFYYLPKAREFNLIKEEEHYDLLIVIDLSDPSRLGAWQHLPNKADKIIVIDHHINPIMKCDVLVSLPDYASTGEIIFNLFEILKVKITKEIASALYTSIACDTGCFLFANTSTYTHYVAEQLMKQKIDIETINFRNFRAYDRQTIPVITYVLKTMQFKFDGRLAISILPYKLVNKWQLNYDSRHGLFKYTTDGNGVVCSIFITELNKGEFNVSLRSLGDIDVSKIASTINGGGHKNASGATYCGSQKQLLKILLGEFAKVLR